MKATDDKGEAPATGRDDDEDPGAVVVPLWLARLTPEQRKRINEIPATGTAPWDIADGALAEAIVGTSAEPAPREPPAPTGDPGGDGARLLVALGWDEPTLYARAEVDPVGTLRLALDRLGLRDRNTDSPSVVLAVGVLATVAALRARVDELKAEREQMVTNTRRHLATIREMSAKIEAWEADLYVPSHDVMMSEPLCAALHASGATKDQALDALTKQLREVRARALQQAETTIAPMSVTFGEPAGHRVAALLAELKHMREEGDGGMREAIEAVREHLATPSALDRVVAEVVVRPPAASQEIARLTGGIRHMANCIDMTDTPAADRRSLFLDIGRQVIACVEILDAAAAAKSAS